MTKKKESAATPVATPKFNTNIHAIFATDVKKEEEGAWVEVNALWGLKIKIRRLRSDTSIKEYEKIVAEIFGEGHLRKMADITGDQSLQILKAQLARAVLIDWKNLRDTETGEDIPYTPETALELMEIKDFREFVWQAANERDTFKDASDADAVKN
jgi:hypothetical protein